jgi:hypothetical protein
MEYVHGFMDRVHGNTVHRLTDFIKPELSKARWRAWISRCEGVWRLLIESVDRRTDGWPVSPSVMATRAEQSAQERHCCWLEGSNPSFGSRFEARFPPKQSWKSMNYVLLTCSGEVDRGGARDTKAVRVLWSSGVSGFWRRSGPRNGSEGGGVGRVPSSRRWIDARCLGKTDRWRQLARRRWLGWGKIRMGKELFIGGIDLGRRGHGA